MARTLEQIKEEMEATQATVPQLSSLNSTSQMAFFGFLKHMWAMLVQLVETSWEQMRSDTEALLNNKRIGSALWYVEQVKKFQLGDTVTVVKGEATYVTIDPAKQIVTQAACVENLTSGRLLIKVVKGPQAVRMNLTDSELEAVRSYVKEIKFAGVQIDVISLREDQIRITATVKIDRQVLAANGSSLADSNVFPVVDAIRAYLRNLPFDSVVSWTALTDYMQTVPGVLDFVISASEIAPFGTNAWAAWSREVISQAGHCVLSGNGNLTYI